jgi:ABC-type polysaccharide/polyol phosphate export permease
VGHSGFAVRGGSLHDRFGLWPAGSLTLRERMTTSTTVVYDSDARQRPLIDPFRNFWIHRSLLRLLITRDLTVRYKRSVLGVWWTILNPLLTTMVMWMVFSQIFSRTAGADVPFIVYLLTGVLLISMFFSQGLIAAGSSLVSGRGILSKIRVPGEVFALTAAGAAMVNFFIGLIPLAIVMLATGTPIPWTWLLIPIPALAMLCLVTGVGMLIAAAAVHFFDVLDLVRVIVQLSIWLVPTFYPLEMIPEKIQIFIKLNPLYSYLVIFRYFAYGGYPAELWQYIMMFTSAIVMLAVGVYVFSRSWRNLVVLL